MDPDSGTESQRALSLQWKSYKLVQDPALRRVTQKNLPIRWSALQRAGLRVPSGGESARPPTAQDLVQIRGAVPASA
ncbi:hypothetical protein CRUP_008483 [Coryphaenoides rupestris]|nr:hypothetical protein CRUP_008483 [Coryphaenoides rupestris]